METTESERWTPVFDFRCDLQWKDMGAMDGLADAKQCSRCNRTVYFCAEESEFEAHARKGNCVAVYETRSFAGMTMNSPEVPDVSDDPFAKEPLIPGPTPSSLPPPEIRIRTAGVPRKPDVVTPTPGKNG